MPKKCNCFARMAGECVCGAWTRKPKGIVNKLRCVVGVLPLPDTHGKRYAAADWKTEREPSGVIVAIEGKDLMLSRADVARHLNSKDETIDVLRRRCEKQAVELNANVPPELRRDDEMELP